MILKLTAACGCNMGKRRRNNEDNFYFDGVYMDENNQGLKNVIESVKYTDEELFYGVFDGMGGQADGQVASAISAALFDKMIGETRVTSDADAFLESAMHAMSKAVFEKAEEIASNMGSTAAVLAIKDDVYHVCNVGDSPVFIHRNGILKQISVDHVTKFAGDNRKGSLIQYIGVDPYELTIEPSISSGEIIHGDQLLICSDGLTDMVSQDQIKTILNSDQDVKDKVDTLIQAALDGGGRDNITVVLIDVSCDRKDSDTIISELSALIDEEPTEIDEPTVKLEAVEMVEAFADKPVMSDKPAAPVAPVKKPEARPAPVKYQEGRIVPEPQPRVKRRKRRKRRNLKPLLIFPVLLVLFIGICVWNIVSDLDNDGMDSIREAKVGEKVVFGNYQDEDISWIVIDINKKGTVLIAEQSFFPESDSVMDTTKIKILLNSEFFDNAFTEDQKTQIKGKVRTLSPKQARKYFKDRIIDSIDVGERPVIVIKTDK